MALFNPWTWFKSDERKLKKEELKLKIAQVQLEITKVEKEIENLQTILNTTTLTNSYPFKSLRYTSGTIIAILHDGTVLNKEEASLDTYRHVKSMQDEEQIKQFFTEKVLPQVSKGEIVEIIEPEEHIRIVEDNVHILAGNPDFVQKDGKWFFANIDLELSKNILASFMEIEEKKLLTENEKVKKELEDQYEALKMFWMWTSLNPIENSRRDLLNFVHKHDVTITKNGMLEMYRKVVSVGNTSEGNRDEVDFVSFIYEKLKSQKKGPASFDVYRDTDNELVIKKKGVKIPEGFSLVGNLKEKYNNLPDHADNRFTDSHTRTKDIRVGSVYKEDEDKIDTNNSVDCSSGLHVGSHQFGFQGFGDTGVMALVNPSKVRSVPISDTNKMRVSEMFIAAVMNINDYKKKIEEAKVSEFSQEYFNLSVDELGKMVKEGTVPACKKEVSSLSTTSIEKIRDILAAKITTF